MIDEALGLLFTRLNEVEKPVLFHSELAACAGGGAAPLLDAKILSRTRDLTDVQHRDGRWMTVIRTADRLFGVSMDEDDYFDPVPLTEEDVRAYEINLPAIIKLLRDNNDLAGPITRLGTPPVYLGRKEIEAWGTMDVHFAWSVGDRREFELLCRELRPSKGVNQVGLLLPTPVEVTSSLHEIMERNAVMAIPLSMHVAAPSLVVDWDVAIGVRAPAIDPGGAEDRLDVLVTRKFIKRFFTISDDTFRRYDGEQATPDEKPWLYVKDDRDKLGRKLYHLRMVFDALGPSKLKGELRERGELGLAQVLDKGEFADQIFQVRRRLDSKMHL